MTPEPAGSTRFPINWLLTPDHARFHASRLRMTSSYAERCRTGLIYDRFFNKCATIAAGQTHVMAALDGPGLIVRLYFTLPIRYRRFLLRDLILRVVYDNAEHPSVEAPLGDFFGLPFGRYTNYSSFFLSCTSGGYVCRFPMPFRKAVRLELVNASAGPAIMVFYQFNHYDLTELPDACPYFMASWRRQNPTVPGTPYTILDRHGAGWYVGCNLQAQARHELVERSWADIPFPKGWGLGTLEGWERVYVDGEREPSFHGTGHEEFFDAGWYFTKSKDAGLFAGNLHRSYLEGRAAAYRQHLTDPIPFDRDLRLEIDHGIDSTLEADYASCAYWYETPPAGPLPPLPADRRPSPWLPHAAQFLLLPLAAPVALPLAAARFWKFLRRIGR